MTEKELKEFIIKDSDFGHFKDYSKEEKMKIASKIIRRMKKGEKSYYYDKDGYPCCLVMEEKYKQIANEYTRDDRR